jgi:hypothetical protein
MIRPAQRPHTMALFRHRRLDIVDREPSHPHTLDSQHNLRLVRNEIRLGVDLAEEKYDGARKSGRGHMDRGVLDLDGDPGDVGGCNVLESLHGHR